MRFPEMVKANHRYRGPMESRKHTNTQRDVVRTLELIREELEKRKQAARSLMGELLTEYYEDIPTKRKDLVHGIESVRGGEL